MDLVKIKLLPMTSVFFSDSIQKKWLIEKIQRQKNLSHLRTRPKIELLFIIPSNRWSSSSHLFKMRCSAVCIWNFQHFEPNSSFRFKCPSKTIYDFNAKIFVETHYLMKNKIIKNKWILYHWLKKKMIFFFFKKSSLQSTMNNKFYMKPKMTETAEASSASYGGSLYPIHYINNYI